jgi:hypothetical protein
MKGQPSRFYMRQSQTICEAVTRESTEPDQRPPFQPCTWLQLAMMRCFTASGNAT